MFGDNLVTLRKLRQMTQEDVASKVGVTRQAVAKWESGDTIPDLITGQKLSDLFGVTLDELVQPVPKALEGFPVPPKGKHLFGVVTVGEKGQIIIPAKARRVFALEAGDQLIVLGDEAQGLALLKTDSFLRFADMVRRSSQE